MRLGSGGEGQGSNLRYVVFLLVAIVVAALVANALIGLLPSDRMRYIIFIWPLLAVIVASGILYVGSLWKQCPALGRAVAMAILGAWLVVGFWTRRRC